MNTLEVRYNAQDLKSDSEDNSRIVYGKAISFDSLSEDLGFREIIHKDAINEDLINSCDIFCLLNHDSDKVLARSKYGKGSLKLELKDDGLYYSFRAKKTNLGNELLSYIEDGDITGSSFAFYVSDEPGSEKWSRNADGNYLREIYKIGGLADVSPVWCPAYESTSVDKKTNLRSKSEAFNSVKEKAEKLDKELDELLNEIESL